MEHEYFERVELPEILLQLKNIWYRPQSLPEPPKAWASKKRRSAESVSPPEAPHQPLNRSCMEEVKKISCSLSKNNSPSVSENNDGAKVKTGSHSKSEEKNISSSPIPENLNSKCEYNSGMVVKTGKPSSSAAPVSDYIFQLTKSQEKSLKEMGKEDLMKTKSQLLAGNMLLEREVKKVTSYHLELEGLQKRLAQKKQNAPRETFDGSQKPRVSTELRLGISPAHPQQRF